MTTMDVSDVKSIEIVDRNGLPVIITGIWKKGNGDKLTIEVKQQGQ